MDWVALKFNNLEIDIDRAVIFSAPRCVFAQEQFRKKFSLSDYLMACKPAQVVDET